MLQWPFRDDEIHLTGNCMMKPPLLFVDWQEDNGENIISSTLFPNALETAFVNAPFLLIFMQSDWHISETVVVWNISLLFVV